MNKHGGYNIKKERDTERGREKHLEHRAWELVWELVAHQGEWERAEEELTLFSLGSVSRSSGYFFWPTGMRPSVLQCLSAICQHGPSDEPHQQPHTQYWCLLGVRHAERLLPSHTL